VKPLRVGAPGEERPAGRTADGPGPLPDLSSVTPDINGAFLASGGAGRARVAVTAGERPEPDRAGMRVGAPVTRPAAAGS
jgi:hypothetical protein